MLSTRPDAGGVGVLGQVPGGTLSLQPGVGGLGVSGQVAGGTLSLRAGLVGLGFSGQVPGGMPGTTPPCGYGPCNLLVPWLATGTPAAGPDDTDRGAGGGGGESRATETDAPKGMSADPESPEREFVHVWPGL